MALQGYYVRQVDRKSIEKFIEEWHYSKSINGVKSSYCFGLFNPQNNLVGAMIFGGFAMAGQWKKYADNPDKIIELRRLCCINETPKNTESFFIGKAIKLLSKVWNGDMVISYSDREYGHTGTIYNASNFEYKGYIRGSKVIVTPTGRLYHDKAIRTKYNGKLKPFAQRLKDSLDLGEYYYKTTKGKDVWIYKMKGRKCQS